MRKNAQVFTIIFVIIVFYFSITVCAGEYHLLGDMDGDREVTILDATAIQKYLAQLVDDPNGTIQRFGDVDGNGLSILDATAIQNHLAGYPVSYPIGEPIEDEAPTVTPTEPPTEKPTVIPTEAPTSAPTEAPTTASTSVTIGEATFDVSEIPDELVISSGENSISDLLLYQSGTVVPEDFYIEVNNGVYENKVDYTDEKFKENYNKTVKGKPALGYDCLVRNEKGEEGAWVFSHYESGFAYPYRARVCGFACEKFSFPLDFYYKGQLIKRCNVIISVDENHPDVAGAIRFNEKAKAACWTDEMDDKEKLQALAKYIKSKYKYAEVNCVAGAVFIAFAARELGLNSMLLYPGGESNQPCPRHYITYNIYFSQATPGGHCACLVIHKDGTIMRYDVQGGAQKVKEYDDPYNMLK
jgi:hypothetical protein